jgi:superfamily II DNA or RNA helicase
LIGLGFKLFNAWFMQWKGANRIYSKQSLQRWVRRLDNSWEERFQEGALKRGRTLYKKGSICEISIGEEDAIMTCKIGKAESYSVVDWDQGAFAIRSSSSDTEFADAIAVAGFLEIEELIADEDLNMIDDNPVQGDEGGGESEFAKATLGKGIVKAGRRMLHLVLDTHFEGLICEAYWLRKDGTKTPALGGTEGAPRAETVEERERLITLAARARKSHFIYSEQFNGYLLKHLQQIPFFVSKVWPTWKRSFSTEERDNVANIRAGFTELTLNAKASLNSKGTLDVKWVLNAGQMDLSDEMARVLLGRRDVPALIPELGIVKLSQASRDLMNNWEELEGADAVGFQPYQLFSLFPDGKANVEVEGELKKWRDGLLAMGEDESSLLECLRPYQREGVQWMDKLLNHGCHCLLADEMGLGKTVQVISLIKDALANGKKALIVCPASVVPVWGSEFEKFVPELKAKRYSGGKIEKEGDDWNALVTSFALMRNRIDRIEAHEFEFAIVDEAQFVKNPDAKVTRACMKIKARKRIALTGTPIENKPLDIWPTFQFLMPGLLGKRSSFEKRLLENPVAFKARLKAQIAPFMLRRTKSQVADDLPEKIIIDQHCPVTPKQADEYARICATGIERLGNDLGSAMKGNRFAALSLLTRLRQASCDPHLLPWVEAELEDSGKLMVLLEKLIEVLGTGHKVVIFSQFVKFLDRIRELIKTSFPDLPLFELTGSTKNREAPVKGFQSTDDTAAMLVSLRAGGSGITLNAADYVFLMDPWWNPAVENQAIDRVHRIGQKNTVFVYRMIAEGTIEERIQELKRDKQDLFDSIVKNSLSGADELTRQFKSLEALLILSQND